MSIMDYIKPEMLVIAVLLYVIGMMVKQAAFRPTRTARSITFFSKVASIVSSANTVIARSPKGDVAIPRMLRKL